jgi:hypothetical protein
VYQDEHQSWEKQLQEGVSQLLADRFSALEAAIRRLQTTFNEACGQLLQQINPAVTPSEAASLSNHFDQHLKEALSQAERDFQKRIEQVRGEAATQIHQLQERLESIEQPATGSSPRVVVSATPPGFDVFKAAIEEIDSQRTQSKALSALVSRAAHFAPRLVFFVIKSGNAIGWKACGFSNGLNDETVHSLVVPIQADTLLRAAHDGQRPVAGRPDVYADHSLVLRHYCLPSPEYAVAVPLVVRGKTAAVLYADAPLQSAEAINIEALEALLRVTSMAIELMPIRRSAEQARSTEQAQAAQPSQSAPPAAPTASPPLTPEAPQPRPQFFTGMGEEQSIEARSVSAAGERHLAQGAAMGPLTQPVAEGQEKLTVEAPPPIETKTRTTTVLDSSGEAEVRAHNDARRFARLLVSEIKLYNEAKVAEGRRNYDLYERLKDDIDRSRQMYEKRVSPSVAAKFDYFYDELVHTLGEGDPAKLGRGCPGPTVPV